MTTCIKQAISQGVSCWEGPLESPGLALAARICGTDQDVQHLEMQLAQRRLCGRYTYVPLISQMHNLQL